MKVVGLDIGASHADIAIWDGAELHLSKHLLRAHTAEAALDVLCAGLDRAGCNFPNISEIRLSQTWALNTLLTRGTPPVSLVTTRGFGDILTLARQDRADLYNPVASSNSPSFLVSHVIELDERTGSDGEIVVEPELSVLNEIKEGPVAVCLLNAHANGANELSVARALSDRKVFLSHQVDAAPREYERAVATCLEASLHAALWSNIASFRQGLVGRGFTGQLLFADNTGALRTEPRFVELLNAGPATAASAATGFGIDGPVIAADLGSCSLDLSCIRSGRVVSKRGGTIASIPLRQIMADTFSASLGGQSRLYPEGPTVDEALTALGRLPGLPSGQIDLKHAERTISVMAGSVRDQIIDFAVARNLDPYSTPIVIMGGLGKIMVFDIADALMLDRIQLAPAASEAGAVALLSAPEVARHRRHFNINLSSLSSEQLRQTITEFRQNALRGCKEVWIAEIASIPQAELERVALTRAPETPDELIGAWGHHMFNQTGVHLARGTLQALELAVLRESAVMPVPVIDQATPEGWRSQIMANGGIMLERLP